MTFNDWVSCSNPSCLQKCVVLWRFEHFCLCLLLISPKQEIPEMHSSASNTESPFRSDGSQMCTDSPSSYSTTVYWSGFSRSWSSKLLAAWITCFTSISVLKEFLFRCFVLTCDWAGSPADSSSCLPDSDGDQERSAPSASSGTQDLWPKKKKLIYKMPFIFCCGLFSKRIHLKRRNCFHMCILTWLIFCVCLTAVFRVRTQTVYAHIMRATNFTWWAASVWQPHPSELMWHIPKLKTCMLSVTNRFKPQQDLFQMFAYWKLVFCSAACIIFNNHGTSSKTLWVTARTNSLLISLFRPRCIQRKTHGHWVRSVSNRYQRRCCVSCAKR